MAKATYVVTVDDQHRDKLDAVAARLERAGMDVQRKMNALGAITGSLDANEVSNISQLEGVYRVSKSGPVQAQ